MIVLCWEIRPVSSCGLREAFVKRVVRLISCFLPSLGPESAPVGIYCKPVLDLQEGRTWPLGLSTELSGTPAAFLSSADISHIALPNTGVPSVAFLPKHWKGAQKVTKLLTTIVCISNRHWYGYSFMFFYVHNGECTIIDFFSVLKPSKILNKIYFIFLWGRSFGRKHSWFTI